MSFLRKNIKLTIKLAVITFLFIVLTTFLILKTNKDICEWWTAHFVQGYLNALGHITKDVPFSITEIVMLGVIILSIVFLAFCLIYLFKKKYYRSLQFLLNITLTILTVVTLYQATAEMAYNRQPVELNLYEEKVDKAEFRPIIEHFIADMNSCCDQLEFKDDGELVMPVSHDELNNLLIEEYKKYPNDYLSSFTTKTKPMISSVIYREFHITGMTFMPTAEANINTLNTSSSKPFTYAHELAHTKGAMREADADLIASYITLHSDNPYIRYSGYYSTIGSIIDLARYTGNEDDYQEIIDLLDERFLKNLAFNRGYWKKHNSWANFADWWNNIYLKLSGVNDGTDNYGDNDPTIDPSTHEIKVFSNYQKLYFSIYYA